MKNMKDKLHKLVGKLFPLTSNKESKTINVLSTTLIRLVRSKVLVLVALSICCLPIVAQAKAHCFCRLGPPSAPIKDFGEIGLLAALRMEHRSSPIQPLVRRRIKQGKLIRVRKPIRCRPLAR